jgi:hypothetical protein
VKVLQLVLLYIPERKELNTKTVKNQDMVLVAAKEEQIRKIEEQLIDLKLQLRALEIEISDLDQRKFGINQVALVEAKRTPPEKAAAIIEKARRDIAGILDQIREKRVELGELKGVIAYTEAERKKLLSA